MENSPFGPSPAESTKDSKESKDRKDSSKTKSAEAIGAVLFEPKGEKSNEKELSFLEKLTGTKEKPQDEPSKPEKPVNESEAPLEHLSDEERQYVETELVAAAQQEIPAGTEDEATDAEDAAVERFREKIVADGEDSETAFTETLKEIESPNEIEAEEEPKPERSEAAPEESSDEEIINLRDEDDTPEPIVLGGSTASRPRVAPTEKTVYIERRDPGDFLVGGIVGYLVGRRRGRIKTEKRLLPVQKKLEKQVSALKTELERKETVIRITAREAARPQAAETKPAKSTERIQVLPPERIGRVLVDAEAISTTSSEKPTSNEIPRKSPLEGLTEKDIVTLDRQELLAVSEKIIVESTSLRHIYETHLIGEKGLRRLVTEFLRGGNLNKALRRELVEKEIDFERDPILRDKNRSEGSDGGGTHLEALLKKVDNLPGGDSGEMAVLKARAAHEAAELSKREQKRKVADTSLAVIISVLIAAILTLLITR